MNRKPWQASKIWMKPSHPLHLWQATEPQPVELILLRELCCALIWRSLLMWLCHDNEVRGTEACLSDWVIASGLLPPPSFITTMIVPPHPTPVLCVSISLSHFLLPDPAFAFLPFQLFINTWWMLQCKKVSLKSLSLWIMKTSCNPAQPPLATQLQHGV